MPYDRRLADRLRTAVLRASPDGFVDERLMFGGLAILLGGSIAVGVLGDDLVVRTGRDGEADALRRPHVRPMDFTGRPLTGFVYVAAPGCSSDADLDAWVARGLAGARNHKPAKRRPRPPRPRVAVPKQLRAR